MYKKVLFFLFVFGASNVWSLVPLEGVIYGDVQDIKQYDPFEGMLTYRYFDDQSNPAELNKLIYYTALYKQGISLKQKCDSVSKIDYANFWKEDTAKRSVIATLQYIGLDIVIKSIAEYAKKFEFSDEKYETLTKNLVTNMCSQNISVYSHRMIKDNFNYYWKNPTGLKLPSIEDSPYFSVSLKKMHNTRESIEKEFDYSIKNFRAFCSWNSDVDSLGLLTPYLKNPFVMAYIINNILQRKILVDKKTQEFYLEKSNNGIQVACENMICRKRSPEDFMKYFPRMNGSSKIEDDLNNIFCTHFRGQKNRSTELSEKRKIWAKEANSKTRSMEAMHLVSLISGYPDFSLTARTYPELLSYFKDNIKSRWSRWAWEKSSEFNSEQLYEESLEVQLVSQAKTNAIELGNLNIRFDVDLGEIDKTLQAFDKISSKFYLEFPKQYIIHLKNRIPFLYNSGRQKELAQLEQSLLDKINVQLAKKKKYFKIPIWNEKMPMILKEELLAQINQINDYRFKKKKDKFIKIPVKINFGVFALHYIRKKYIFRHSNQKTAGLN